MVMSQELIRKKWPLETSNVGWDVANAVAGIFGCCICVPWPNSILRERECRNCGKIVHTKETI